MDPVLQWILGIFAVLVSAGVIAAVRSLAGIKEQFAALNLKLALFIQSAESRFERLESHDAKLDSRVTKLEDGGNGLTNW